MSWSMCSASCRNRLSTSDAAPAGRVAAWASRVGRVCRTNRRCPGSRPSAVRPLRMPTILIRRHPEPAFVEQPLQMSATKEREVALVQHRQHPRPRPGPGRRCEQRPQVGLAVWCHQPQPSARPQHTTCLDEMPPGVGHVRRDVGSQGGACRGCLILTIVLDGRPHPEGDALNPTYLGHSVGRWEGDTLVVDVVGFNENTWIDFFGYIRVSQIA